MKMYLLVYLLTATACVAQPSKDNVTFYELRSHPEAYDGHTVVISGTLYISEGELLVARGENFLQVQPIAVLKATSGRPKLGGAALLDKKYAAFREKTRSPELPYGESSACVDVQLTGVVHIPKPEKIGHDEDGDVWKVMPWYKISIEMKDILQSGEVEHVETNRRPNQALEPMYLRVTPSACAEVAPRKHMAHLER